MRVDEDCALENSPAITNLLVDDFIISMKTTGGYASWLNGNNERHNIIIHNMARSGLLDNNHHLKMVLCSIDISRNI